MRSDAQVASQAQRIPGDVPDCLPHPLARNDIAPKKGPLVGSFANKIFSYEGSKVPSKASTFVPSFVPSKVPSRVPS